MNAMEGELGSWPAEIFDEEVSGGEYGLPPGFRFHPTDEELVTFYLASKIFSGSICGVDIVEVDLNRCEPWELPEAAKMGEREWYFFSLRDRKYPTGLRTNRATGAGYWKATGKDREIHAAASGGPVGMKKTLVFYKGRAPRGEKTRWVLHEYRLHGDFSFRHACKEEWVICRIFHKGGGDHHQKKTTYFPNPNNNSYINLLRPTSSSCSSSLTSGSCFSPLLLHEYCYPPQTGQEITTIQSLIQSLHLPFNIIPQTLEDPLLFPFPFTHISAHHPSAVHLNSLLIKPPPLPAKDQINCAAASHHHHHQEEESSCGLQQNPNNFFCYDDMPLVGYSSSVMQSGPLVP